MSEAPLYSALLKLAGEERLRFHMPGHKGRKASLGLLGDAAFIDYTELPQTGNLYEGNGPINEAERLAAEFYGASNCAFLTGGSTQGITAAMYSACRPGSKIILDRNCHRCVINACGLMDLDPSYIYPPLSGESSVTECITPEAVLEKVQSVPEAVAVVVTSPTYYGAAADIGRISEIVHNAGMKLIVDEAHGAHFPALGIKNAVLSGADISVCSAHKTLPALGQSAFLFSNSSFAKSELSFAASIFGTSSPSYPILASIDLARAYLCAEGGERYRKATAYVSEVMDAFQKNTAFRIPRFKMRDPCRLTVETFQAGLSGLFTAERLREDYKIDCEMADYYNIVFIVTCEDGKEKMDALYNSMYSVWKGYGGEPLPIESQPVPRPEKSLSPRVAMLSKKVKVGLKDAEGMTAAQPQAIYPPGIPVIMPGELIDRLCIEYLIHRGYNDNKEVYVVKD
ncbi:MAG: aminotransferase class V-fold PLP-dependent enzyme [Bacillota bacterium]|nr:aminotransferase class V-fold PLP-dependent enzyme [Bacillota bacterium]